MTDTDDFLEHFGKKGMKWGQRNRKVDSNRPGASKDYKRKVTVQKKAKAGSSKALSNKEIQDYATRVNLERQYSSLNPNIIKRGDTAMKSVLAVGGTAAAMYKFANSSMGQAIKKQLTNR